MQFGILLLEIKLILIILCISYKQKETQKLSEEKFVAQEANRTKLIMILYVTFFSFWFK